MWSDLYSLFYLRNQCAKWEGWGPYPISCMCRSAGPRKTTIPKSHDSPWSLFFPICWSFFLVAFFEHCLRSVFLRCCCRRHRNPDPPMYLDELIQRDSSSVFYNCTLSLPSTMLGMIWGSKRKLVFSSDRRPSWNSWSGRRWIGLGRGVRENDLFFDKKKVLPSLTPTHTLTRRVSYQNSRLVSSTFLHSGGRWRIKTQSHVLHKFGANVWRTSDASASLFEHPITVVLDVVEGSFPLSQPYTPHLALERRH